MKNKIITEQELREQVNIEEKLFQEILKLNLIRPKGTADENVLIFGLDAAERIKEIKQFQTMGYSLEEIEKISKKVGLPSTKKDSNDESKKVKYLTVGELANRLDINARTLKYWEERGIIEPDTRSEGGFRLYSEHWIFICKLIKDLQLFGFTLEEIKEISELFRDFLVIQKNIESFSHEETKTKLKFMREQNKMFYQKINQFKEGINRWEEILKKKEKEIRQLQGKLEQTISSKESKEKK